jgi:hypothetical protein
MLVSLVSGIVASVGPHTIVSGYRMCATLMFLISSGEKSPNWISCTVLSGAVDSLKSATPILAVGWSATDAVRLGGGDKERADSRVDSRVDSSDESARLSESPRALGWDAGQQQRHLLARVLSALDATKNASQQSVRRRARWRRWAHNGLSAQAARAALKPLFEGSRFQQRGQVFASRLSGRRGRPRTGNSRSEGRRRLATMRFSLLLDAQRSGWR